MHTSQRISKFYEDLENLGLKFPGKELSEKLGVSKGYVSDILNKKKEPSEEFLTEFYKKFTKGSPRPEIDNYPLPIGNLKITLKDYIDLLTRTNEQLYGIINSTLGRIHNDQQIALAYQKAWVDYEAEKAAKGDQKRKKEIMYKMNKLVDGILQGDALKDIPDETGKTSMQE